MKIPLKILIWIVLILGFVGLGWYWGFKYSTIRENSTTNVDVILEKIKEVNKFVAIEGHFSEVYDYKDYYVYDISPFRKKALIRVKGKVLAGFNFEKINWSMDESQKIIRLTNIPEAEILSIDHELDYYDLQEGSFNQFDEEKLNELNSSAKEFIIDQAKSSGLLDRAEERKVKFIQDIKQVVEGFGWSFETDLVSLKD